MSDPFPAHPGRPSYRQHPLPPPAPPAPPGTYGVPVGGYRAPVGGYQVPPTTPVPSRRTGAVALIAALLAAVVAPIVAGILSLRIGMRVQLDEVLAASGDVVWSALSPVRTQVLWIEILFWTGTALGILALALGIAATVRSSGRGMGITAIGLAFIGPAGFLLLVSVLFGVGNGIGLSIV